jgi:Ca2+-transporting ATPase
VTDFQISELLPTTIVYLGLPLAVTLALAFATKRMTYEKLLVRVLGSYETMANASVVCTDKTGTLTQNVMSVAAGSVGIHAKFVRKLEDKQARTNAHEEHSEDSPKPAGTRKHPNDFSIDQTDLNKAMSPQLQDLFNASIAVNSTAFEDADPVTGEVVFVGSKTETALLKFAKELGWVGYKKTRDAATVLQMILFSSERKAMGVMAKLMTAAASKLVGLSSIVMRGMSAVSLMTPSMRHDCLVNATGDTTVCLHYPVTNVRCT